LNNFKDLLNPKGRLGFFTNLNALIIPSILFRQCRSAFRNSIYGIPPGLCPSKLGTTKSGPVFLKISRHFLRICRINLGQGRHPIRIPLGPRSDDGGCGYHFPCVMTAAMGAFRGGLILWLEQKFIGAIAAFTHIFIDRHGVYLSLILNK
jgi:hypothetical protein